MVTVQLRTPYGTVVDSVGEVRGGLSRLLGDAEALGLSMLRYVDPYGDTYFNYLQAPLVLRDLEILKSKARSSDPRLVEYIEGMARRSQSEPHLLLAFLGD